MMNAESVWTEVRRVWYAATHAEELIATRNAGELASKIAARELAREKQRADYLARENKRLRAQIEDAQPASVRLLRRVK